MDVLLGALERRGAAAISLALVAAAGALGSVQVGPNGLWATVLLVVVVFEFQKRIDQGLPLLQIAAILATLQWVVGPVLGYGMSTGLVRYNMYVDASTYFSYALPGTAAFAVGLLGVGSSVRQRGVIRFASREHFFKIGLILNAIAFAARWYAPQASGGLAFATYLVSQVGYVGALYFLFSGAPSRWLFIALSVYPLFRISAESAMFHDMLLWSALLFCYWYGMRRHSAGNKAALLVFGMLFVFTVQAIKGDYRAKVWAGQEASLFEEVQSFWSSRDMITSETMLASAVLRLNQGWIISAVLANVPDIEPYAEGETLKDAATAALVPRFLMPDKVKAGGQVNFRRFTGLPIENSTSMAISPLGEAYANFGPGGGVLLMFVYGLLFAGIYSLCLRWVVANPDFLFWLPLIFYQSIKAETEFATVLNQMSKGMIVAFGLYWVISKKVVPLWFGQRARLRRPPLRVRQALASQPG